MDKIQVAVSRWKTINLPFVETLLTVCANPSLTGIPREIGDSCKSLEREN